MNEPVGSTVPIKHPPSLFSGCKHIEEVWRSHLQSPFSVFTRDGETQYAGCWPCNMHLSGAGVRPWPLAGDVLSLRSFLSSLSDALVAFIWGLPNVQISFVILGSKRLGSVFTLNMLMFEWMKLHLHASGLLRMSPCVAVRKSHI